MARGKNEVTLTFAGDSQDLEKAFDRVGDASRDMSRKVDGASADTAQSLDRVGQAADEVDTRAMGFRDSLTGVQDSMEGVATLAKGDLLQGLFLVGAGVGDLGSSIFNFVVPSLKAMAASMNLAKIAAGGLALGVVGAAIGLALWSSQSRQASTDIKGLTEDLDRFLRTGMETEILRRNFGTGSQAVEQFAAKLHEADSAKTSLFKRSVEAVTLIGVFRQLAEGTNAFTEAAESSAALQELDMAMAALVAEGQDADAIFRQLASTYQLNDTQIEQLKAQLPQYTEAAKRAEQGTLELQRAQTDAAFAVRRHTNDIKDLANALRAQTDPVFAFVNAQRQVAQAQKQVTDAAAEFGRGSSQYRDAVLGLAQAQLGLVDATARAANTTDASLVPALQRLRNDGLLTDEAFAAVTGAINETKAAADRLDGTRIRMRVDVVTAGLNALRAVMSLIPGAVPIPKFHSGGVMPGAPGSEGLALLQAGETITPAGHSSQSTLKVEASGGSGFDRLMVAYLQQLARSGQLKLVQG